MDLSDIPSLIDSIPDDVLELSRINCGTNCLDSIVLANDRGRLTRLMLAWPGHLLDEVGIYSTYPFGIHNHLYDFYAILICGNVRYGVWQEGKEKLQPAYICFEHFPQTKKRYIADGLNIDYVCATKLRRDVWSMFLAEEFNDFTVSRKSAWVISEEDRVQDEIRSYYRSKYFHGQRGGPFKAFTSANHVRDTVKSFFKVDTKPHRWDH